jgi:hypothetical protein
MPNGTKSNPTARKSGTAADGVSSGLQAARSCCAKRELGGSLGARCLLRWLRRSDWLVLTDTEGFSSDPCLCSPAPAPAPARSSGSVGIALGIINAPSSWNRASSHLCCLCFAACFARLIRHLPDVPHLQKALLAGHNRLYFLFSSSCSNLRACIAYFARSRSPHCESLRIESFSSKGMHTCFNSSLFQLLMNSITISLVKHIRVGYRRASFPSVKPCRCTWNFKVGGNHLRIKTKLAKKYTPMCPLCAVDLRKCPGKCRGSCC